mmetsp:Transcript_32966/g.29840  ORF Transcript_32966/g.29840 Transcript_32966/m.29840 type:complete len:150 (+) Transcript_32966:310-759(+)
MEMNFESARVLSEGPNPSSKIQDSGHMGKNGSNQKKRVNITSFRPSNRKQQQPKTQQPHGVEFQKNNARTLSKDDNATHRRYPSTLAVNKSADFSYKSLAPQQLHSPTPGSSVNNSQYLSPQAISSRGSGHPKSVGSGTKKMNIGASKS